MDYIEAVEFVHSRTRLGSQLGLGRISALLGLLGNPQKKLRFIHIAGTNGKGSITTYMSDALTACGLRTGRYISPFVIEFRERFSIDGEFISPVAFASVMARVKSACETLERESGEEATEFEVITAAAFVWYAQEHCDVVCLEVGLGGRFDATNVIDCPEVAVIASIAYDHTEILGDTIEKIAFEKCGIVKTGCTVVAYPQLYEGAQKTISDIAKERGCRLVQVERTAVKYIKSDINYNAFEYAERTLKLKMHGEHQRLNAAVAYEALCALKERGFDIDIDTVLDSFSRTIFPARIEVMRHSPLMILDGAHNADGADALASTLDELGLSGFTAVCGILREKSPELLLERMAKYIEEFVAVTVPNSRTTSSKELAESARKYYKNVVEISDPHEAVTYAEKQNRPVLIFGSLYLASAVREYLK